MRKSVTAFDTLAAAKGFVSARWNGNRCGTIRAFMPVSKILWQSPISEGKVARFDTSRFWKFFFFKVAAGSWKVGRSRENTVSWLLKRSSVVKYSRKECFAIQTIELLLKQKTFYIVQMFIPSHRPALVELWPRFALQNPTNILEESIKN